MGSFLKKRRILMRIFMRRPNFRQRGFTLVEMIFVLAIILTLIAIFLPLATSKISDAKTAKARADEDSISAALLSIFSDVGIWPASHGTSPTDQTLRYLLMGDPTATSGTQIGSTNPTILGAGWATGILVDQISSAAVPTSPAQDLNNAFNHLVVNNPNANAIENDPLDYRSTGKKRWRGPYIAKLGADPYGNNYIINIGAITGTGTGTLAAEKGWILSAGPDGTLATAATDSAVSSDDIGYIFCTRCQ